ncbi:hypothetical protein EV368DRAFT_77007 [Lentinula lateritia]|nr:hypothetical protein EV368DRAFT_77007 [Lentinula lateritia]
MLIRRIGILIIGEAHMNSERRDEVDRKYGKDLKIFYTKLPDTANAGGVAIVLNRNIMNVEGIQTHEIVPGHAMLLEYCWHNTERLSILAIYAPNTDTHSNTNFWLKMRDFFIQHPRIRKPDFMVGDCNMVEEPLDRLPAHELKSTIQIEDGWRNTYRSTLKYTYKQSRIRQITKHSRLDRIYVNTDKMIHSYDLIAPATGQGRWVLPKHMMYDVAIKKFLDEEGKHLETEMNRIDKKAEWDPIDNHQTIWSDFKRRFTQLAQERAKIVVPKLIKQITELKAKIDTISNDPQISEEEHSLSTAVLKDALSTLEERRYQAI